jgi:hypothetical protein
MIKKVFKGKRSRSLEQAAVMTDHCSMMHRLDSPHQEYYCLYTHADGKTDMTIQEYLNSRYGEKWRDPEMVARVQHYIKWLALQHFANPSNQQMIKKRVKHMADEDEEEMEEYLAWVRHALTRINAYHVRIFAAMLFGMCTVQDILNVKEGDKVEDKVLKDEEHRAYAKAFRMLIRFYKPNEPQQPTHSVETVCYPLFAPPSAMKFLMYRLGLSERECQWTQHVKAGIACPEEAMAEKLSFWHFWKGEERFCPLEQYASDKAVKELRKLLVTLS